MPPAYEVLLLNTAIPQIQAAQSGDTYVVPRDIAFSTVASLAAGTEALPSLVATGDVNTGFWFPAADTIAASTGGTRRLTLTSNGDLGVGTTSPRVRAEFAGIDSGFYAGAGIYVAAGQGSSNYVALGQYSHMIGGGGSANAVLINNGAGYFSIYNNGLERARITSTGEFQWKPDGSTQAMTLDASGRLLVGLTADTAAGGYFGIIQAQGSYPAIVLKGTETSAKTWQVGENAGSLTFYNTTDGERARITSGGYFKASNTGTYVSSTSTYHELRNDANANTVRISNSIASGYTDAIIQAQFSAYTPNAATAWFLFCDDTTNQKAGILSTGTFESRTSTYGGVSDVKLKTNIVDANSQWNDLKAVRVRNFAFKDEPNTTMLGVVAQEIEEVSPGLVYETPDRDKEGNDLGTITKSVKYSILYMKAIKALQEAMARIETLEAEVAALKGV